MDLVFKLKPLIYNNRFVSYGQTIFYFKTLTDGLKWCGLLVDYCDVFISCLDTYSDGTHSLQTIHYWASDVTLHFSMSFSMKRLIYLLSEIFVIRKFYLEVNYSFKAIRQKKQCSNCIIVFAIFITDQDLYLYLFIIFCKPQILNHIIQFTP